MFGERGQAELKEANANPVKRGRWLRMVMPALGALALVAAAFGLAGRTGVRAQGGTEGRAGLPTARVTRGNLDLTVYARGQTRPVRTAMLIAPQVRGSLQITHLLPTGTRVKKGELVIEFDPSEQEYLIELSRSEVLQAEQEIIRAKADGTVQAAEDEVALLKARFDVRRAELEVGKNELVSAIDARKNELDLQEARRRLAQLEQDIQSKRVANRAGIAVQEQRRNRERLNLERAQADIKNMQVTAPFDGLVAVKENRDASGGFFFTGMVLPDFRPGDLTFPGRTIAEVLDTSEMEIQARVDENDRARLEIGQPVEVRLDADPRQAYSGKVKAISGQATRGDFFGPGGSTRTFEVTFVLDAKNVELRPGVSAQVIITGQQVKNVLLLPRQAVFEKDSKPVVYVRVKDLWEPRPVKVLHRTESRVAVDGVAEGTEVALANPEKIGNGGKAGKSSSSPPLPGKTP
ncbi:MAG TPA: efflux RND transporter periplasmic adaptor subunit [Candidatus Nitrosotenuis sp.]|nr:efflux RND transporter periplasmic adaptor subunit [Candidatus Nitrosotenuis sp.]